jgi:hypothetical protein
MLKTIVSLSVKVGDLVKDNHPARVGFERVGVLVENVGHNKGLGCTNKIFKVLWRNGTIGNNVWDNDLEFISEGR